MNTPITGKPATVTLPVGRRYHYFRTKDGRMLGPAEFAAEIAPHRLYIDGKRVRARKGGAA